jgi:predicted MFS family arabinose efflux permease
MEVGLFSNRARITIILSSNFTISVLQTNLAAVFSLVGPDFHQGVSGLGIASSLMFLGICASEIPGGILEVRIGARNAIAYMMFLCSLSSLVASLTTNFPIFLVTRFTAGLGIGAAFPPIIVVLTRYFRSGSEGTAVGWNSLSYNMGVVIGLAGWAALGAALGWRISLLLGGILSAGLATLLLVSLPRIELGRESFRLSFGDLKSAFSNRQLSLITIALFGIGASSFLTTNFLVYYLETTVKLSLGEAGLIGGIGPIFAITAPFVGRYYDRSGKLRTWILLSALVTTVGVAVTALGTASAGIVASVLTSIGASTGYTVGLTRARSIGGAIRKEYESVALAWCDSVSLLGGFVAPVIFSAIVTGEGYAIAWFACAFFALILVIPLCVQ